MKWYGIAKAVRTSGSRPMSLNAIRDGIRWFSNAKLLRKPLVAHFNCNQQRDPHVQVWAVSAAFYLMCEAAGIDPHDMIIR